MLDTDEPLHIGRELQMRALVAGFVDARSNGARKASDPATTNDREMKAESLRYLGQRDCARSVIVRTEPAHFEGKLEVLAIARILKVH